MKHNEEEIVALDKKKNNNIRKDNDENNMDDDEIEEPFKVSKKGLDNLMNSYLSRKLDEELVMLEKKGGIKFLEDALVTDFKQGLTDTDDYINRKKAFDSNEQEEEEPINFCEFVKEALEDKIVQILIVASIISIVVHMVQGHNPEVDWVEGFAIIVTVLVVILVGSINNYNKEAEFRELKKKNENEKLVTVKRNNKQENISIEKVLVGDLMKIEEGMALIADGILIEGNNITIDESAMTGETDMIEKEIYEECMKLREKFYESHPEVIKKIPENWHHKVKSPILSSGTQIASGSGWMIITAVGPNSQNGKILSMIEANKQSDEGTPMQQKLTYIADFVGYCGLGAAILTAIGMAINLAVRASQSAVDGYGPEIMKIFLISITVIVVAIPEGLPLAVTLTLSFSIKKMIQDKNLVRRMEACETMGGADFICTDKTGTLTKNEMNIVKIHDGINEIDVSPLSKDDFTGKPSTFFSQDFYDLFKLNSSCNTTTEFSATGEETSTFKTDLAFTKVLKRFGEKIPELRKEYILYMNDKKICIPFSSKRKKMSTFVKSKEFPQGYRMLIKGGSEIVLPSCNYYRDGLKITEITREKREHFEKIIKTYAEMTLRTVVIGYKELSENELRNWENKEIKIDGKESREVYEIEESGFIMIAIIGIMDILKEGVEAAVVDCQLARINLIMVTGDNITTACAIAKACNIMNDAHGRTKAMLGEAFIHRCGGVVCENCFKTEDYLNALKEVKQSSWADRYNYAINKCKYKCECYRTEEEGKLKTRQKIIARDLDRWKNAQNNEEAKKQMDEEIQKKLDEEIQENPPKIKKDVIANKEKFEKMIRKLCVIARSQPSHKYCLVTGLRELEHVVAVTGDGTNDAAALSKADVGFAMNNGTDIAKEASDIIITDNNFTSIVQSVLWGRNVYDNIRRFLQFQLSVNVVACTLVFIGSVTGAESPLSAIQMLWVNMIMDSLGSLALATESPHRGLLDRPPARKTEFMVNRKMTKHVLGQSLYQLIILFIMLFKGSEFLVESDDRYAKYGFGLKYCFDAPVTISPDFNPYDIKDPENYLLNSPPKVYVISGLVPSFANSTNVTNFPNKTWCNMLFSNMTTSTKAYEQFKSVYNLLNKDMFATTHFTVIFNTFVLMQLFNEICCRIIDDNVNICFRISTNSLFFVILLIEFGFQVLIVQVTGVVFKVNKGGLGIGNWAICIGFSLITFIVNFLVKFIPDALFEGKGNEERPVGEAKILSLKGNSKIKNASLSGSKKESISKKGNSSGIKKDRESSKKAMEKQPSIKGGHMQLNAAENHV